MSDVSKWPSQGFNEVGTCDAVFSFVGSASDPATTSFRGGWISSITHTATGVFTVNLANRDVVQQVVSWSAWVADDFAGNGDANPKTATVAIDENATGGVQIKVITRDNGAKNDVVDRRVCVRLCLKNSGVAYRY